MIQHYLCKCTIEHQSKGVVSISHCDVWARGVNEAKIRAAADNRCAFPTHIAPSDEMNRIITVEEEIIPGPDEVMYLPGYDSGDMECWCYDVNAFDFERVVGRAPDAGEGTWDNESILPGLPEPHWQLGMDAILKWADGRPIRLEAKKIPPGVKEPPLTYAPDQMTRRCMTSAYLCQGVLSYIEEKNIESIESPGGSEFMSDICSLAQTLDDWLETNHIDVEELTDGYYLYEIVEQYLAEKIVDHIADNDGDTPSRDEFIVILEELRKKRKEAN